MKLNIEIPDWLYDICSDRVFLDDEEKMKFVIDIAKRNIKEGGGPFGAAIFSKKGELVSCGANLVLQNNMSVLHAEIIAIMLADKKLNTFSLSSLGDFELFSSSEPCAMCLGACLWSGVKRVVFGASKEIAKSVGFDEGPVFEQSWDYLKKKGIEIKGGVLSTDAEAILYEYRQSNGIIYNG